MVLSHRADRAAENSTSSGRVSFASANGRNRWEFQSRCCACSINEYRHVRHSAGRARGFSSACNGRGAHIFVSALGKTPGACSFFLLSFASVRSSLQLWFRVVAWGAYLSVPAGNTPGFHDGYMVERNCQREKTRAREKRAHHRVR